MFRVENNVPDVYPSQSRDFQLVSRLYDLVFQSSRFSIDSLVYTSDSKRCNSFLLPLISAKVGLFDELKIPDKQYRAIISGFPHIIKYKGSIKGLKLLLNLLGRAFNIDFSVDESKLSQSILTVVVSEKFLNIDLLYTLVEYVAPSGILVKYEQRSEVSTSTQYAYTDDVKISSVRDDANAYVIDSTNVNVNTDNIIGFAEIFGAQPNE